VELYGRPVPSQGPVVASRRDETVRELTEWHPAVGALRELLRKAVNDLTERLVESGVGLGRRRLHVPRELPPPARAKSKFT
jgi:hypothetical protein